MLSALVVMSSLAQVSTNPPTASLDTLQQVKELDKKIDQEHDALQALSKLEASIDRMSREKYLACMQAFGSDSFCTCLAKELPVVVNFDAYVHAVTSTKEELGYGKMSEEDKGVLDKVLAVREHCVANMEAVQSDTTNKQSQVKSPSPPGPWLNYTPDKPAAH